jgi:tight adherence protein C
MDNLSTVMQDAAFIKLATVGIGLAVMLAAFALLSFAGNRSHPLRRRLSQLGRANEAVTEVSGPRLSKSLGPLGAYLLPKHEKERETLRLKLIRAGYRSDVAAINLYVIKVILVVLLPLILVSWVVISADLHPAMLILIGSAAAFAGMMLPNFFLNRRIDARHREMLNALPDALDLMVSCTEAGLGLNAALQRVAKQMDISSPLLGRELEQVNAEIRGGMDRIAALRNLTYRTGLNEIRGLVSLLSQSVRFGSAIADILRIYAEEFRDKRMQAAEEQAALVGTKLIFPLCFCIFPAFFIVAVGPAVVALIGALATTN